MYREVLNELAAWKDKADRHALLLVGAKGVGKSYVVKDFAEGFFKNYVLLDLKEQDFIKYLFEEDFNKDRVVKMLSVSAGDAITPDDTLIIVENIEKVSNLDRLISFFAQKMNDYHVCFTTSCDENYIINSNSAFKVDVIHMYPLCFSEFLRVNKEAEICNHIEKRMQEPLSEHESRVVYDYLKLYAYVGGMPEVVNVWLETQSLKLVEEAKKAFYDSYMEEFAAIDDKALRHKVIEVYSSVGRQLLKENKKFMYGEVRITARAREYNDAVEWLIVNKYVSKVNRVKEPVSPLEDNSDVKSIELFLSDLGILTYMYDFGYDDIDIAFKTRNEYLDAMIEQFVEGELLFNNNIGTIYYWVSEATAKINFLFEDEGNVVPVEINLSDNTKAQSIKVYRERYNPRMYMRVTMDKFMMDSDCIKLPVFSVWNI